MDESSDRTASGGSVAHLADHGTVKVHIERDDTPFASLGEQQRMRLIVRILCELVAYGETDEAEQAVAS